MDTNALRAIYTKVQQIYNTEDNRFLCFPLDFQYIFSPESLSYLFEEDAARAASFLNERADFSRIVNRPVKSLFPSSETSDLLWDVYQEILMTAELAEDQLSPQERDAFQKAEDYLFEKDENGVTVPSKKYKLYSEFRDRDFIYEEQIANLKTSETIPESTRQAEINKNIREKAENETLWMADGLRQEVETQLEVREKVFANSPLTIWEKLKTQSLTDLNVQSDLAGGTFANTFLFPNNVLDQPWCTIKLGKEEISALISQASAEVNQRLASDYLDTIEQISFDYRSVGIQRPWFNPSIFKSRLWRLPLGSSQKISYGSENLLGRFPAYISALLLLRNFQISYSSGKAIHSFRSLSSNQNGADQEISVLAYICKRIPVSPNPDENVKWPTTRNVTSFKIQQNTGGVIRAYIGGDEVDSGDFGVGAKVTLKAVPEARYILRQWKINGVFVDNVNYIYECMLPEEGLTIIPCWELGDSLDHIQFQIEKDILISFDKGPANLDMNRYGDLCRVKVIADNAFHNYTNLCSITLGNFVEIIGEHAFSNCKKLERISIPAATQTIHKDAFSRDNYQQDPIIQVNPANETFTTLHGILIEKRKTLAVQTLTCKCGSKFFFSREAPTICPACGCALDNSLTRQEVVRLPDVKIPFKVTPQEAEESVRRFFAKKGFAAKEFKEQVSRSTMNLRPVYTPYWEWNVQANGTFTVKVYKPDEKGDRSQSANTNVENEIETHTEDVSIPETKISIPASRVVKDVVLKTDHAVTEAFEFDSAPAETAFELYSKNFQESQREERQQVLSQLQTLAKQPYNSSLLKSCDEGNVNYISETSRLLINPIWIGSFPYKEKTYTFYADGYTGKVTARNSFPKNWGKIAILAGSILAIIALIVLSIVILKPKRAQTKDTQAPTISNSVLNITDFGYDYISIQWDKAKDNITEDKDIRYVVYLLTPGDSEMKIVHAENGISSYSFQNLKPESQYYFFVRAQDGDSNVADYDTNSQRTSAKTTTILSKQESVHCDGVYGSSSRIFENMGDRLNRDYFEIAFDFNSKSSTVENNNILTLDTYYRSLGLTMRDNTLCVTTNNQDHYFNTSIPVRQGAWQHIDLVYDNGRLTINGTVLEVGQLNGPGNNILSSNNFSNGSSFKGDIRNLVVRSRQLRTQ